MNKTVKRGLLIAAVAAALCTATVVAAKLGVADSFNGFFGKLTAEEKHLMEELPFMATENILMDCVRRGGDRQTLHEAIRRHSVAAGKAIKQEGADNDLLDRIAQDPVFRLTREKIDEIIAESSFTGRAAEQTREYAAEVRETLAANADAMRESVDATINV